MGMKKIKSEGFQLKLLAVGMALLAAGLLLPLFGIAHFSVKCVDDYVYFRDPEAVWQSTHSIWELFRTQFIYAADYWKTWQGTYFSEWLVTVLMGICGDSYYFVGAYLAIGGMVLGELFLFKVIFSDLLSADFSRTLILSLTCILMQILLMPTPVEAFYWYCSAGLYTWIYALAAVLAALVLDDLHRPLKGWRAALREAGILFLAFAVGGSNYVISIFIFVLWGGCVALLWLYRHGRRKAGSVNFLFFTGCMLLAVCSPGNLNRMNASGETGYSAAESIFRSLLEALGYLDQWAVLPYIVAGIMMAPLMTAIVKRKKYRYPCPGLVTVITFGMFAAQFTPNLYTLGITGAGRVQNLYRMTMCLWLYGNEFYWIGWLERRMRERYAYKEADGEILGKEHTCWLLPGWCAGLAVMVGALWLWGGSTVTSASAFLSLYRGQAQRYRAEYEARMEILEDPSVPIAELAPYSDPPYLLFFGDIVEDPEDWVNRSVADVYGKEAVKLIRE